MTRAALSTLAIDCGNTRLKWGLFRDGAWRRTGAVLLGARAQLDAEWSHLESPDRIVVSNVAGDAIGRRLAGLLSRWQSAPLWVQSKRSQCGVTNSYDEPERLGTDRWAALIGAWSLQPGPSLVVNAGTATTADILAGDGNFAGGIIFPGVGLMQRSLAQNAAGLFLASGRFDKQPRNTADAIETGCLLAQAGAIERLYSETEPGSTCFISGGDAPRVASALRVAARQVENLVLEGLLRMAE